MAEFDTNTRQAVTKRRKEELNRRIAKISGQDKELAEELAAGYYDGREQVNRIAEEFYADGKKSPSD